MPDRISFGIKTSQNGIAYPDLLRIWQQAEQQPLIEHAWLWDHMVTLRGPVTTPTLEAWTLLAALAAQTSRLELGVIVTSNRLRPPALLAKMAATVDVIAGGRLVFGIGAGGSAVADPDAQALVRQEYDGYGIDVVSPGEAVGALGEACEIARRMWTETEPFDFTGRHYTLRGAVCEPKPVRRPPVMIGARGPRALRVVAEHADIWNCPSRRVDDFRSVSAVLDEQCAALGRDPATVTRSVQLLVAVGAVPDTGPVPTFEPPAVRDLIAGYVDAGVRHLVLAPVGGLDDVQRLVDEVIEPVRAGGQRLAD